MNPTPKNEQKGNSMSTTDVTAYRPPRGLEPITPGEPDCRWSASDLEFSADYVAEFDPEDGEFRVYNHGIEVPVSEMAATITDAIKFWSRCRAVQAELAARQLDV